MPFFADDRLPVTLLTGFLGSGKTTVLNRMLRQPELGDAAVVVNEFGDIGLDHDLMASSTETVVLLESGCLCCSIRGDLVETLYDLLEKRAEGSVPPFERVVIETTGLADPAPVVHTLVTDQVLAEQFRLEHIVTVVDAAAGESTLDNHPESLRQAALADRLVLTKTDLAAPDATRSIERRLREINPGAPIIRAHNGLLDWKKLFVADAPTDWLRAPAFEGADLESRHGDGVVSVSLSIDKPISMETLDSWLDALIALQGPNLLRIKGLVNVEGLEGPLVLHGVQHVLHPPAMLDDWPSEDRTTRIVLIARNIPKKVLEDSVAFLRGTARGAGPLGL